MVLAMMLVQIAGKKKSGKTKLAESIVSYFSKKYNVAFIKHIHHAGEPLDRVGSDTYRVSEAGAKVVVGISPDGFFLKKKINGENFDYALRAIRDLYPDCQLAIIEGFHNMLANMENITRIYVSQSEDDALSVSREFPQLSFIYCEVCHSESIGGIKVLKSVSEVTEHITRLLESSKSTF